MQNETLKKSHFRQRQVTVRFHIFIPPHAEKILHSAFSSAFSLIELIVVMVIAGILITVVIIKFTAVQSASDSLAASELVTHLNYIRNMAMNSERTAKVVFDVSSNRYDVYLADGSWTGTYSLAKDPVTQKDWGIDVGSKFPDVTLATVNINGNNTLYFGETNGAPFDYGFVPLSTTGTVTFGSGIKVTITPETGYAGLAE